jgi:hypothetical protein
MSDGDGGALGWTPPARPEWLLRFNEEARGMDPRSLVPLDPDELVETAQRRTGFRDFGDDAWREPFLVLVRALEEEAQLHPFGRMMTRCDLLIWLEARLGVEAAFREHPEIADEKIDRPLVIAGLSRSGTSILFELLAQDPDLGSPRHWEMVFPYPPPERATRESDPRIGRCQHLITQWSRVAPSFAAIHEMDARLPNECVIAQACTFVSEYIPLLFQVPSYLEWLATRADWTASYAYYRRMLQLWQWHNPRRRWLLKAPSHLNYLPILFDVFPDARVLFTHRDPIRAQASLVDLAGTIFWMRSDKPMRVEAFEGLLAPEAMAARLDRVIDWLESGAIPKGQCASSLYADLVAHPVEAVRRVYERCELAFTPETERRVRAYLAGKPQGKFGRHEYEVAMPEETRRRRALFARYQAYFGVPDEVT